MKIKIFLFLLLIISSQISWARFEKVEYKELTFKSFQIGLRTENLENGNISAQIEVRKGHDLISKKVYEKID